jgi:hypothetical protein
MSKGKFQFSAKLWRYPSTVASWHFISLPKEVAQEIKEKYGKGARAWGSLAVEVLVGKSKWDTSIFRDNKSGTYILPVKATVRKKEGIVSGDECKVVLTVKTG